MPILENVINRALRVLAAGSPAPRNYGDVGPVLPSVQHSPPTAVTANGIELTYDSFGDRSDPPVLLVMGLGEQMLAWEEEFCARLAGRGFWVVRFDNRDVGLSTRLHSLPAPSLLSLASLSAAKQRQRPRSAPYHLRDMAADTVGLLDALRVDAAHVVGISMGGMIAQLMAIHHRERVRSLTSIMSDTGDPDLPMPHPRAVAPLLFRAPPEREAYIQHTLLLWRIIGGTRTPIDGVRTVRRAAQAYERGPSGAGTARQLAAILAAESRTDALRSVTTPTLVIHGEADPLVPVEGGRLTAASVPGAQLRLFPDMGHALPPPFWIPVIDVIERHLHHS